MAYSIGLTLYNLSARRETALSPPRPQRPAGRLIWLHAPVPDACAPLLELARRLVEDDGHAILITHPNPLILPDTVLQDRAPPDTPADVRAFLDHWRPDLLAIADGELRPALLHEAAEKSLPVICLQAWAPYLLPERDGWYPGLIRSALGDLKHVLALDEASARAFRKAGAVAGLVEVAGRMEEQTAVLPHTEAERASMAEGLAARPIWLVAGLDPAEEDAVIAAHKSALRLAHRLLMIVAPQTPEQATAFALKMEQAEGWNVAQRLQEQEPEPHVEVLVADSPAELGLWYRLAPITFLGGTLLGNGCLRNPMEAAALGSAMIAGPRPGNFGTEFVQLATAHALRDVGSSGELADALSELLAPDRAARLANAAWGAISDGAEVTDRVITLIRQIIDGDT